MKRIFILLFLAGILSAQVRVTDTRILNTDDHSAIDPVFSADGNCIVYGSDEGLFIYDLSKDKSDRFAESGFEPVMDDQGLIRYRTDSYKRGYRTSSFRVYDTKTKRNDLMIGNLRLESAPKITNHGVYYIEKNRIKSDLTKSVRISKPVAFTLDNKVVLYSYGTSKILSPAGDKPHIWPSVSPVQDKLCVVGENDLYICDLNGNILSKIEDARAPRWSPDGKWIVFMRDTDDGHVYTGSDLFVVRENGTDLTQLTFSTDRIEMFPQWSPNGDQIICSDPTEGKPILLTLEIK